MDSEVAPSTTDSRSSCVSSRRHCGDSDIDTAAFLDAIGEEHMKDDVPGKSAPRDSPDPSFGEDDDGNCGDKPVLPEAEVQDADGGDSGVDVEPVLVSGVRGLACDGDGISEGVPPAKKLSKRLSRHRMDINAHSDDIVRMDQQILALKTHLGEISQTTSQFEILSESLVGLSELYEKIDDRVRALDDRVLVIEKCKVVKELNSRSQIAGELFSPFEDETLSETEQFEAPSELSVAIPEGNNFCFPLHYSL